MTAGFLSVRAALFAGIVGIAALGTLVMGLALSPVLALGLPVATLGGAVLLAEPFLGLAALVFFSHLDSIEKLLFGFLPISAFKLLTAGTVAATVLVAARRRDWVASMLRDPVVVFALVFALLAAISFLFAGDRGVAMGAMRKNASLLALLLLIVALTDTRQKLGILLALLVATSFLSALILIADTMLGTKLVAQSEAATTARTAEGFSRSSGASDYNPTTAASMLLVGVVVALVHVLESRRWRLVLLGVVGIGSLALVFSFARSSAIAYGLIVVLLAWRWRTARAMPLALYGVFAAGLAALPFIPAEYWERIGSIFGGGGDWTLLRRLSYNLIGLDLLTEHPFFGVGPGNFYVRFTDAEYRYFPGRTLLGRELHNMYLSVLVQYGLIGGAAFLAMIAAAMTRAAQAARAPATPELRIWALGLAYGFAGYLVASLFLPNEYTKYTWVLCGICAAMYRVNALERSRIEAISKDEIDEDTRRRQ